MRVISKPQSVNYSKRSNLYSVIDSSAIDCSYGEATPLERQDLFYSPRVDLQEGDHCSDLFIVFS